VDDRSRTATPAPLDEVQRPLLNAARAFATCGEQATG
jgi:hypothetical protein